MTKIQKKLMKFHYMKMKVPKYNLKKIGLCNIILKFYYLMKYLVKLVIWMLVQVDFFFIYFDKNETIRFNGYEFLKGNNKG